MMKKKKEAGEKKKQQQKMKNVLPTLTFHRGTFNLQ
jgi:hypothetical protein